MATAAETRPLTAEQFGRRHDPGHPEELVRGEVVSMPPPGFRHGKICYRAARLLGDHVERLDLGTILTNDSGVITERDPDTVRGADVAFYSHTRLPRESDPEVYPAVAPDLVVEVRSPSERWGDLHEKVAEYLKAGVRAVVVLDPDERSAHLFTAEAAPRRFGPDDEMTLPEILADFRVIAGRFFA